jgi:GTPase Era involved in 16S rRNA processing
MNMISDIEQNTKPDHAGIEVSVSDGFAGLDQSSQEANWLHQSLTDLEKICDESMKSRVALLRKKLTDIEPSVTMIGQVKAGKTSLLNAMVGWPDLLPADVNPWTSVVTSLHLSPKKNSRKTTASFKFFEADEWNNFLANGGRLGELANRAGASEELEKVREQLEIMREKSRSRLGKKFELLLGQNHDYSEFDTDLIEKYVCLGEFFDEEDENQEIDGQGRFADITKSADLYLHRPELPMNMCFRDTPGVNDTFMMREQITIRAIRDSRICVVVLSAHQALSSVDMALIRMITNIKSREVVIFVNRIDELPSPETQVAEIRDGIRKTLKAHSGPEDAQIIFGSAYWANAALKGGLEDLEHESAKSLVKWSEANVSLNTEPDMRSEAQLMWDMSGIPALFDALSERILEGEVKETVSAITQSAYNLARGVQLAQISRASNLDDNVSIQMDQDAINDAIDEIEKRSFADLEAEFTSLLNGFENRLDVSHNNFLDRATSSLLSHLETKGENEIWEYSPTGLRMMLDSAYSLLGSRIKSVAKNKFEAAATDLEQLYKEIFSGQINGVDIQTPKFSRIPPAVFLGQTIALDLKGPWWKNWWIKRKGSQAFAENFHQMIKAETDPIVHELKSVQPAVLRADLLEMMTGVFTDQRAILTNIVQRSELSGEELTSLVSGQNLTERREKLEDVIECLTALRPEVKESKPMMKPSETPKPTTFIETPIDKPRIALMGEFSSGKSTLTNLLLGADPLPTRVTATQLAPVWVSYGDQQNYYENKEGEQVPFSMEEISEIDLADASVIRLFLKSEILQLCDLIDMPGISDPNMASDVWENFVDQADSVLWCTPSTQAWRQSEAALWQSLPSELYSKSMLVVTRKDKLTTEEDRARVMRRVKRETVGLFAGVHHVSLTQAIAAYDEQEIWEDSGADVFATQFVDILSNPNLAASRIEKEQKSTLQNHADDQEKSVTLSQETIDEAQAKQAETNKDEVVMTRPQATVKTSRPSREEMEVVHSNILVETDLLGASLPTAP